MNLKEGTQNAIATLVSPMKSLRFWIGFTIFTVVVGTLYFVFAFLGLVPSPDLTLTFPIIISIVFGLIGFIIFALGAYLGFDYIGKKEYRFIDDLDKFGETKNSYAVSPEEFKKWTVMSDDSVPTRRSSTGNIIYMAKNVDPENRTLEPARDLQDSDSIADDQYIASKDAGRLWQDWIVRDARAFNKIRGAIPALRERIEGDDTRGLAASIERSAQGGEMVDKLLQEGLEDYENVALDKSTDVDEVLAKMDADELKNAEKQLSDSDEGGEE
ncbi:hypothetical protein ACFQE1_02135 [Halobium palmae]|uniref:Uncharacterized protein n=1 Tax=Halobium palmae TaxID=1776492 RepID=A0ABD5RUV3_9EURY